MKIHLQDSYSEVESLVLPVAQSAREQILAHWAATTGLPAELLVQDFKAEHKEIAVLYPREGSFPARRLILLGVGERPSPEKLRQALRALVHQQKSRFSGSLGIDFLSASRPAENSDVISGYIQAACEGALLGQYDLGRWKTAHSKKEHTAPGPAEMVWFVPREWKPAGKEALERAQALAAAQMRVLDLVNAPPNHLTAEMLGRAAQEAGKSAGFSVTVLSKKEIEAAGMGGLLAVNRGSALPPAFIIMEYQPAEKAAQKYPKIGLVGKGVTFDSGGISLKTIPTLHYLKSDMAGGAAVIGVLEAAARLQLAVQLIGVVPATENMPDGAALRPGDVITTYAGITVEVEDTDAEGRLILADGLAYLKRNFNPDAIIDLATLTGAATISLGNAAAALFTQNEELAARLSLAGEKTGERVWRLPLWDDYNKSIESAIADVKNYGGPPAGAITAAKFLEKFLEGHPAWAHLDIASVAFTDSEFSAGKSSTGFGVRLLIDYLIGLTVRDGV